MPEINYLAVLASAIGFMIIGSIWYGPLFGNLWMKGMGWDPNNEEFKKQMQKSAGPAYLQMFIGAIITSYVFAHVLWAFEKAAGTTGVTAGIQGAIWMWLGFILPLKYSDKLWNGKAFKYVAIDLSYQLAALLLAGIILSVWVK